MLRSIAAQKEKEAQDQRSQHVRTLSELHVTQRDKQRAAQEAEYQRLKAQEAEHRKHLELAIREDVHHREKEHLTRTLSAEKELLASQVNVLGREAARRAAEASDWRRQYEKEKIAERSLSAEKEHLQRTVDAIVKEARRPVLASVGRSCDAAEVVRDRVGFWSALAADQEREVRVEVPDVPVPAAIDATELADVLDVLLDNVFAHTPEGTALEVALSRDSAGAVRLEVIDAGPGLADPALTERGASGAGSTGLGLDIVRRAAAAAGGELLIRRGLRGGTVAIVTLAPGRA